MFASIFSRKLKNEIDLSKEQLIKDIEQKHEQLINKLKEIETKYKPKKVSYSKLEQTIKENKERLNEWTEIFKSNLNRGDCCESISNESGLSISEVTYEMIKCQVALLDNKEYKFNSFLIEDKIFGDLVTNDVEIINESRLEGTIRFEIKFFSEFRYKFGKSRFIDKWFVVDRFRDERTR